MYFLSLALNSLFCRSCRGVTAGQPTEGLLQFLKSDTLVSLLCAEAGPVNQTILAHLMRRKCRDTAIQ
jgi:hypothetical protein